MFALSRLTDRQRLCLRQVHAHMSSKEIATHLGIGPGTVDQHIKAAMLVLGVSDRREAAQMLVDHEAAASEGQIETASRGASPANNGLREILASVRHGLRNVLNVSGHDTREQFRPYAVLLLIVSGTIALSAIVPRIAMAGMRIQKLAAEHGELPLDFKRGHPGLTPDFADVPYVLGALTLVHLALVAAAVARRRRDWSWAELWTCLPLPAASIAWVINPQIILNVPVAVLIFGSLYALIGGGAPERIVAAISLAGIFVSVIAITTTAFLAVGLEVSFVLLDFVSFLALLLLALRANRIWPLWVAALGILGLAARLIMLLNPMVVPAAYGAVAAVGAYPLFLMLIVGTRNHRRRLRLYGEDPAWTPMARLRGSAMPSP